jgi:hypothetical protein
MFDADPDRAAWARRLVPRRRRRPGNPTTYEQAYVEALAFAFARAHRPRWSWTRVRVVCNCGSDLPCRARVAMQTWAEPLGRDASSLGDAGGPAMPTWAEPLGRDASSLGDAGGSAMHGWWLA